MSSLIVITLIIIDKELLSRSESILGDFYVSRRLGPQKVGCGADYSVRNESNWLLINQIIFTLSI
jgi:hypothetical protein